jgi:hypothetical protein
MARPIIDVENKIIIEGSEGQVFYSLKPVGQLTSLSSHHKRKIKTEKVLILESYVKDNPKVITATKVTLL